MKASRFSDAQKAFILKQGSDGMPVAEICRKAGISQATYFNWKRKYDGLLQTEMRRLKQLEDENAKLRKVVADLSLDKGDASGRSAPKNLRPVRRRKLVDEMRSEWRVSIRRACRVFLLEAGKLQSLRRSKDRSQSKPEQTLLMNEGKLGSRSVTYRSRICIALRKEISTDPQPSLGSTGETAAIISSVLSHSAERLTLQIPTGKRLQDAGIAIDSRARRVTDEVQWEPPI